MKKIVYPILILFVAIVVFSCARDNNREVEIPQFNFSESITFESSLSSYGIYSGVPSDLNPTAEYQLLELSSVLFTDYAYKQRLVKIPVGEKMSKLSNGKINFPEGTVLVKTFYYYNDERDTSLGKQIIETRLLIKEKGVWNIATYQWYDNQTEAQLSLSGVDKNVSWINEEGTSLSTMYHLPSQNECITCHQSSSVMTPIGPTVRNMNRMVTRAGVYQNQLDFLHENGLLDSKGVSGDPKIVNFKDVSSSLEERGRAYLDMNCSHCHNPNGWNESAERGLDLRYETSFDETGIDDEKKEIRNAVLEGEMPFIGTSTVDEEGILLLMEYLNSL